MLTRMSGVIKHLSLTQRFTLVSLVILVIGMIGIGQWVGQQIESRVVSADAATVAVYADSFVAPHLQELGQAGSLTPQHFAMLDDLLRNTSFGENIAVFKVWDQAGRILYSTNPSLIGRVYPGNEDLARAWRGEVTSSISSLEEEENVAERERDARLLEVYSPVRRSRSDTIIAVAEFYYRVDGLENSIADAQRQSWLAVGLATLVVYLALLGGVRWASRTIVRQRADLNNHVAQLTDLLAQNEELRGRLRHAAASVAELHERLLRRISAELHDGPAQDVGLALLRLDTLTAPNAAQQPSSAVSDPGTASVEAIQGYLRNALHEVRTIAAGFRLQELEDLTLPQTLARVVRAHEQRTGTPVTTILDNLPEQASLPVKITAYRLIQEALNNAFRHAGGLGQQVRVSSDGVDLCVEVSDRGPGIDPTSPADGSVHLGLVGMHERVLSLEGTFRIESAPGQGTKVIAHLPLYAMERSA